MKSKFKSLCRQVDQNPFNRDLRTQYYTKKKLHKRKLKQNVKFIRQKIIDQLDNLHNNNPKEYWNLVNELEVLHTEKQQPVDKVPPEKWNEHFTKLP